MAKHGRVIPLALYSALVSRAALAAKLGYQYGGDRDIYRALGYNTILTYDDFLAQYTRQDIAAAIIDRPVDATWRKGFNIVETREAEDTEFEEAWKKLYGQLGLRSVFPRLDRLSCIGSYGVLLLGLSDARSLSDFAKPVQGKSLELLYVKPFGEGSAKVESYDSDPISERYGRPLFYQITSQDVGLRSTVSIRAHYSRVIHVAHGQLESEVEGTSALLVVFNRLKDLEKIVGASAEMFWRGARPGYQGKVDPNFTLTAEAREELQEQLDEFEHNLRRVILNEGISWEALASQVADPAAHVDVQIQMISAVTGIPKRILTGSERGELASTQDRDSWHDLIESRREEIVEPSIIRPFIDRCIEYGVLPSPGTGGYTVVWSDLRSPSDKDRAEVGRIRASALKEYTANPASESVVPVDAFYQFFLGFSPDEIELIAEMREAAMQEEVQEIGEEENEGETGLEEEI